MWGWVYFQHIQHIVWLKIDWRRISVFIYVFQMQWTVLSSAYSSRMNRLYKIICDTALVYIWVVYHYIKLDDSGQKLNWSNKLDHDILSQEINYLKAEFWPRKGPNYYSHVSNENNLEMTSDQPLSVIEDDVPRMRARAEICLCKHFSISQQFHHENRGKQEASVGPLDTVWGMIGIWGEI